MKEGMMPESQGHIGIRETTILLVVILSARIFLGFSRAMSLIGGTASWLSITIAFAAALIGFLLLDALLSRFPGQDLIGIADQVGGRFYALLLGLVFFLFFLADTAIVTRHFAETFVVAILPETPISVISGVMIVLLIMAGYYGLESISRLAMLYGPYLVILMLLVLLAVLPNADFLYLTPLLGSGVGKLVLPSLAKSSIFAEITLLGFWAPALRPAEKRRSASLKAMLASYLIMTVNLLVYTAVFDFPETTHIFFPVYQMARLISYLEFFQRVEAIFVFLWFFAATIALSAIFYATAYIFSRTFNLPSHRPLLFPLAILVFGLSFVPDSFSEVVTFDIDVMRVYGSIPVFLLPGLLLPLALLRGKPRGGRS